MRRRRRRKRRREMTMLIYVHRLLPSLELTKLAKAEAHDGDVTDDVEEEG